MEAVKEDDDDAQFDAADLDIGYSIGLNIVAFLSCIVATISAWLASKVK